MAENKRFPMNLKEKLGVGTSLGGRFNFAWIEFTTLSCLKNSVDGWEKSSVEEVLTDRLHVEVHQGGGQADGTEQGARLILSLNL